MLSVFFAFLSPWDYTRDHKDAITREISLLRIKLIFMALTFEQFTVNSRVDIVYDVIWRFLTQTSTSLVTFQDICWYVCHRCHCRTSAFSSIIFHSFISREELSQVSFHLQKPAQHKSRLCSADCQKRLSTQKESYIIPSNIVTLLLVRLSPLLRLWTIFFFFAIRHYTSYTSWWPNFWSNKFTSLMCFLLRHTHPLTHSISLFVCAYETKFVNSSLIEILTLDLYKTIAREIMYLISSRPERKE